MRLRARFAPEFAGLGPLRHALRSARRLRALFAVDARSTVVAAALGAAIVIAVAVPLAAAFNIWIDEAFTLHSTGAGALYAWRESLEFEAQPPLYFVIEALWRTLNEGSIAFARFPSSVFAAAGVAVVVGAAHRLVPRIPPLTVALITAFNPIVIWAATEMRVYALVFFAGAVLTWTFYTGYLVAVRSRRAQTVYIIAAIAGLYAQYYTGFFLLAHALTLLVVRRRALRAFLVAMAVVAAAFAPFAGVVVRHVSGSGEFVTRASLLHVVHEIGATVSEYILPHDHSWSGAGSAVSIAVTAMLLALIALGRPAIRNEATRALVLQWLMCAAIYCGVFLVAGLPYSLRRHIIVIAPSSILIALLLVASVTRRPALICTIALATFAACTVVTLGMQYRPPLAKAGDWQRVGAMLAASPPAPIAVFPAEYALALGAYLPRPVVAIPRPMPFTYRYVSATALHAESDVSHVLEPVRARHARLWLVTADVCRNDGAQIFDYHCRFLQKYLRRRYRVVKTIAYPGSFATLYARISARISSGRR